MTEPQGQDPISQYRATRRGASPAAPADPDPYRLGQYGVVDPTIVTPAITATLAARGDDDVAAAVQDLRRELPHLFKRSSADAGAGHESGSAPTTAGMEAAALNAALRYAVARKHAGE